MARKKKPRGAGAQQKARGVPLQAAPDALQPPARRKWFVIGAVVLLAIVGALLYALPEIRSLLISTPASHHAGAEASHYVGTKACVGCHQREYDAWANSHHARAMQEATAENVLGDFNRTRFQYAGNTSQFFRRDGKFFVRTDGPDGKLADFEIKYTFGVTPLQQYLIEFPDGRIQALPIAWDTRPRNKGGQRWFHLYPSETITSMDELHWTRPAQNWNFMCADCHSTGLQKNYDVATDSFKTRWAEISVGCEGCHGPGSQHLAWAKAQSAGGSSKNNSKGLTVSLDERRGISWRLDRSTGNPARSRARGSEREVETCAQCHARRSQIAEGYAPGKPFLDHYRPALLTSPLYHADGQQRGEVYTWGSFLQSKMYASGVTCSDCHDPHSNQVRAQGNALCTSCHVNRKYDTPEHHHHRTDSAGAACVACHMPATTYMVVDPRHDHSLRVPRPDLTVQWGTPNACNACHKERDARWAAAQVRRWYGREPEGYQRYTAAFAAARTAAVDGQAQLRAIAADASHPAIARATAVAQLDGGLGTASIDALAAAVQDRNPLLRLAALQALAEAPPAARLRLAAPLLADPLRAIRIEAASLLAPVPVAQLDAKQRAAFERAGAEYVESQRYNADRADARVNLGTFYANRGDAVKAEAELKAALRLDRFFVPAYVNLADLYRALGRDAEGEAILRQGLKAAPNSALLHHATGLALVRLKRTGAALTELERAAAIEPSNVRFAYVYAVALHSAGKVDAAMRILEKTLAAHPNHRDVLEALASFSSARGDSAAAARYVDRLRALNNGMQASSGGSNQR